MRRLFFCTALTCLLSPFANAGVFSEFEPNPPGADPAESTFELAGTAGASFDFFILSLENDGFNGTVDRAANVVGTFDSNGLAVVQTPDLENPSFTVVLTDSFTGAIGDDLDLNDDGNLDLSSLGNILDAVGVSDIAGDDATLYGEILGGTDIFFNGAFEPLSVFRSGSTGEFFQTVTLDFGTPEERIGVFTAGGVEVDAAEFDFDPTATSFGAINSTSTAVAIPEPTSLALIPFAIGALAARRRRK